LSNAPIRVTVWGENLHEQKHEAVRRIYPDGMHTVIAEGIREHLGAQNAAEVRTATLDQPEHGLTDDVLAQTDVLTWWGHMGHPPGQTTPSSKSSMTACWPAWGSSFCTRATGPSCSSADGHQCTLRYREAGDRELVWTVNPAHPITEGVPPCIVIPEQEMYGEPFDVPPPDDLVFISSFSGGEVFRSGCCYTRGQGASFTSARATKRTRLLPARGPQRDRQRRALGVSAAPSPAHAHHLRQLAHRLVQQ
jgi:trehalose utilization protein